MRTPTSKIYRHTYRPRKPTSATSKWSKDENSWSPWKSRTAFIRNRSNSRLRARDCAELARTEPVALVLFLRRRRELDSRLHGPASVARRTYTVWRATAGPG